jgi:outer membrane protease
MIARYYWLLMLLLGTGRCLGQVRVAAATGYEQEDLHWSIAGNSAGQDPNIYSELKWRNTRGVFASVDVQWTLKKRWRIAGGGSRTFTRAGSMTDTDYGLDNRHDVLYHEQFPVTGGYSESGSLGVGYVLFGRGPFFVTPALGYAISSQHFPVTDGGGPFAGLNSSYDAKWFGPFVRVDGLWRVGSRWQVDLAARYDQVVYRGVADWNLIAQFAHPVSFRHRADGYGVTGAAGVSYVLSRRLTLSLKGDYLTWETGTGIDELYLQSGSVQQTQLNGVWRNGFGMSLRLQWLL